MALYEVSRTLELSRHKKNLNKLDMCLWNTDAPGGNKVQLWQKSLSPTFWPCPTPQGRVMSVKCEQPLDELTVQVWYLYHHPNFKYCTLIVSGTELRTDGQTDGRTDRQTNGQTDGRTDDPITRCPRRTFQAGGIKIVKVANNGLHWSLIANLHGQCGSEYMYIVCLRYFVLPIGTSGHFFSFQQVEIFFHWLLDWNSLRRKAQTE